RDLVSGRHPFAAVLECPAGRRVDFRREVVGQKEDMQGGTGNARAIFLPAESDMGLAVGEAHDEAFSRQSFPEFRVVGAFLQPAASAFHSPAGGPAVRGNRFSALPVLCVARYPIRMKMKASIGTVLPACNLIGDAH